MLTFLAFLPLAGLCSAKATSFCVASSPAPQAAPIDPSPVGFSYDFGFDEWWFNVSNTRACHATLKSLTGQWPVVRLAGGMDDTAVFDPNFPVTRMDANITGLADALYYGPRYFTEVLAKYPGPIIFGLNRGADNITNTITAAKYMKKLLPNLIATEIGNEPDIYASTGAHYGSSESAPQLIVVNAGGVNAWTAAKEASSAVQWQLAIGEALQEPHIIQIGGYVTPIWYTNATYLLSQEPPEAFKYIKSFSHHFYPQSVSPLSISGAPNLTELMSHASISASMAEFAIDRVSTDEHGMAYIFGETNTVSGGGSPIISPTFGSSLYILDYVLRAASSKIVRLNFHFQSYGTSYYIWWDKAGVRSPYYGGYVAAEVLAGQSYIAALDDGTTNYAGYVVYSKSKRPSKVVLINTDYFDGNGTRSSKEFTLTGLAAKSVSAKRLTATSAMSRQDFGEAPTYGGRSFSDLGCHLSGKEVVEKVSVKGGKATFTVFASEAIVVTL